MLLEVPLGSMQEPFYNVHKFMTSNTTSTNLSYENVQIGMKRILSRLYNHSENLLKFGPKWSLLMIQSESFGQFKCILESLCKYLKIT